MNDFSSVSNFTVFTSDRHICQMAEMEAEGRGRETKEERIKFSLPSFRLATKILSSLLLSLSPP
jgi:hypothetical protein